MQGRDDSDSGDSEEEDDDGGELVDRPQTNDSFILADLERQVLDYDSEEDEDAQDLFGQRLQKQQRSKGRKPKEEKAARKEANRLKRLQRLESAKQNRSAPAQSADVNTSKKVTEGGKKKKRRIGIVSEEIAE